jgi:hypothetical protein
MFHELRLYTPSPGRLDDLVARIGFDMVPYFERHGFSRRLGQWTAVAGETTPVFVWLLQWQDMAERASAFAGLGADADWNALRTRTNGPGEMVKRYDIRFLAPAKAWLKQTSAEREPGGHRLPSNCACTRSQSDGPAPPAMCSPRSIFRRSPRAAHRSAACSTTSPAVPRHRA